MRTSSITLICLFSCLYCFSQIPSYVPTDSLKAWFPFNGNPNDESGHGNNGTSMGATLTTDRFGTAWNAYYCNGASYIRGSIADFTDTRTTTVSVWVDYVTGGLAIFPDPYFQYGDESGPTLLYAYYYYYDAFSLVSNCLVNPTYGFHLHSNWHHLVIVDSFQDSKIFLDGAIVDSWSSGDTTNCYGGTSYFSIGSRNGGTEYVDDIGIWSRALNKCEIAKLYLTSNTLITDNPKNDTCFPSSTAIFAIANFGGISTYHWQQDDGGGFANLTNTAPYSGVNTNTLTIAPVNSMMNNYRYRCVLGDADVVNSCLDTSTAASLIVVTSGISFEEVRNSITVTPNPARNLITVKAQTNIYKIQVANAVGQIVLNQKNTGNTAEIEFGMFPKGVYFLKMNDIYTKTVVKE